MARDVGARILVFADGGVVGVLDEVAALRVERAVCVRHQGHQVAGDDAVPGGGSRLASDSAVNKCERRAEVDATAIAALLDKRVIIESFYGFQYLRFSG